MLILAALIVSTTTACADTSESVRAAKNITAQFAEQLAEAQQRGDEVDIRRVMQAAVARLGGLAGIPEVEDEYQPAPESVRPLTLEEAQAGFAKMLQFVRQKKWWRIGLDPTKTEHLTREVATIIVACTAGVRADAANKKESLQEAIEAADFLIWCQKQGEVGVYPFPAFKGGRGAAFEAADRFLRRAEREGRLHEVIRNGWAVEDFSDGGLQFDNGLCGVAMFELYDVTKDEKHLASARAAADWAVGRPVVTNWNYNSFSVYLLAHAFRVMCEQKYLESAKTKARLGVLPGQLTSGPHKGRWADSHNARPAYHYIMIRGLVSLLGVLPADDPDRKPIIECVRLALLARNSEFVTQGIMNVDSSLEALLILKSSPKSVQAELADCKTDEAFEVLERHASARLRNNQGPAGPGVIGRYFEYVCRQSESYSNGDDADRLNWTTPAIKAEWVQYRTFDSAVAKTQVSYHVYIPKAYNQDQDKDRKFPVLYWLHGTGGGLAGIRPLSEFFDDAVSKEKIPPMLVVFPNGLATSMWCDSKDGRVPMETIVIKELIPHVDQSFRTVASRDGRVIEGFSMGGYGAGRLGFKFPDLFGGVSVLAGGPLDLEFQGPRAKANPAERQQILRETFGDDMDYYKAQNPLTIAEKKAAVISATSRIRVVVGDRDFSAELNRAYSEHLMKLKITHDLIVVPNVSHATMPLLEGMGESNWDFYRAVFEKK